MSLIKKIRKNPLPVFSRRNFNTADFTNHEFYPRMVKLSQAWNPFESMSYGSTDPNGFQPYTDLIHRWLRPHGFALAYDLGMLDRIVNVSGQGRPTLKERQTYHIPYVTQNRALLEELAFDVPEKTQEGPWLALAFTARLVLLVGDVTVKNPEQKVHLYAKDYVQQVNKLSKEPTLSEKEEEENKESDVLDFFKLIEAPLSPSQKRKSTNSLIASQVPSLLSPPVAKAHEKRRKKESEEMTEAEIKALLDDDTFTRLFKT